MRWVVENMDFQKASNSFQQENGKKDALSLTSAWLSLFPFPGVGCGGVLESFSLFLDDGKGQHCELHWVSYS
jgi:hypothetical protein